MRDENPEFSSPEEAYAVLIPRAEADRHRPRYHFLPPAGWMNDPNGTVFHKGLYHLFYQHNPYSGVWVTAQHWGHAVSRELVHWEHWPIALAPTGEGPDHLGVWSGSVVMEGETAYAFYTGVRPEKQCLAISTDGLRTWEKYAGNPIISAPPEGSGVTEFRDPHVWRESDGWYMAIGTVGDVPRALLYRSGNLLEWEYLGPLLEGGKEETGQMWECPDFFALGGRQVLLVTAEVRTTWYVVGDWRERRFAVERWGKMDWGPSFVAARTLGDDRGRRIIFGWAPEMRPAEALEAAGWGSCMSLPRVLSLNERGEVVAEPVPELLALRGEHWEGAGEGECVEVVAELEGAGAVLVRRSPSGEEETAVRWDPAAGMVSLDLERSSLDPATTKGGYAAPVRVAPGEALRLRAFVDRSIIEVFAQRQVCLTGRMYPTREDAVGVRLEGEGKVEGWEMG